MDINFFQFFSKGQHQNYILESENEQEPRSLVFSASPDVTVLLKRFAYVTPPEELCPCIVIHFKLHFI